jgi:metallophosphoesterase superfamily enzyme
LFKSSNYSLKLIYYDHFRFCLRSFRVEIRGIPRQALDNMVNFALEEKVNFVLVAGDLYDGDWQDFKTGLYFANQMRNLGEAGIRVAVIRGNHDAANTYCSRATKFTRQNHEKSWKYSLIPHHVVMTNMSFNTLSDEYEFKF